MMELMKIDIAPFCRTIWTSDAARERYAARITAASSLVQELEIYSVLENQRPCAWQTINEKEFPLYSARVLSLGLVVYPVKRVKTFDGFAHRHEAPKENDPASICTIVARRYGDALEFKSAHESGDHEKQGYFLGFPKCCCERFAEVWREGYFDPIFQSAENSEIIDSGDNYLKVRASPYSNPMLRYIGIRFGFHIPCRFNCEATIIETRRRVALIKDAAKKELLEFFRNLLSMPISWDVLHGIAIIRTPIFYIDTSSIPTRRRFVVETDGGFIPDGGGGR